MKLKMISFEANKQTNKYRDLKRKLKTQKEKIKEKLKGKCMNMYLLMPGNGVICYSLWPFLLILIIRDINKIHVLESTLK